MERRGNPLAAVNSFSLSAVWLLLLLHVAGRSRNQGCKQYFKYRHATQKGDRCPWPASSNVEDKFGSEAEAMPLPSKPVFREKICTYDEYRVSGLVLTGQDERYTSNLVGIPYVFTLGLFEIYALPYVMIDLPRRAFRHYELRVWYDCNNQLITYKRINR